MNMRKAGRVRNDGVRDKGDTRPSIRLSTRPPAAVEHLGNHLPLLLDISGFEALHARYKPRIPDHIRHQVGRVAADGVEFQLRIAHEAFKDIVCCQTHPVTVFLETIPQSYKRLYVAATTDYLYQDVELGGKVVRMWRQGCFLRGGFRTRGLQRLFQVIGLSDQS